MQRRRSRFTRFRDSCASFAAFLSRRLGAVPRFVTRRSRSNGNLNTEFHAKPHQAYRKHLYSENNEYEFGVDQCEMYLEHMCNGSNECFVRHDSLHYLWRVQDAGKWIAFDDSVSIEEAFCCPENSTFTASYQVADGVTNTVEINFCTMQCSSGKVQRLSTPSYVTCRTKCDATQWLWYWNCGNSSEKVWILYGEDCKPPYQDVLESRFLADDKLSYCFEFCDHQFELNFMKMTQMNIRTGAMREICRRPHFLSEHDLRTCSTPPTVFKFNPDKLPHNEGWLPMDTETPAWADLVPMSPERGRMREVYTWVSDEFHATFSQQDYKVFGIYRVQNLYLWNKYQNMKSKMEKLPHLATVGVQEQNLFHGTPDEKTVRCICHQNFDPRMHGRHATKYGKGAYFSTSAEYSHQYTESYPDSPKNSVRRFMFFARVLVGKSTLGRSNLQRPPPVDLSRPHGALYDSCVNSTSDPTIFVIFDNDQCYPEFLIEYEV